MSEARIATRDTCVRRPLPMTPNPVTIAYRREFVGEDARRVRTGLIPRGMDDKWHVFIEEGTMSFHRSWTGRCIYVADVSGDDARAVIENVRVELEICQKFGEQDARNTLELVVGLLLQPSQRS